MTASELLFEEYLRTHGWSEFRHEVARPNTTKLPDYEVRLGDDIAFFEVKEWDAQPPPKGFGAFDPYAPIREKINAAQKQLRPHKGAMCCVVLSNPNQAFVQLDEVTILGAMLGNVGFTMPFDQAARTLEAKGARQAFLEGGKMLRYTKPTEEVPRRVPVEPQNTTISAVVVLSQFPVGQRRFDIGRARCQEDFWVALSAAEGTDSDVSLRQLRVQVYENPYTVKALNERFGSGPWDERFGERDGRPKRVTSGELLRSLENEERAVGIPLDDALGLREV